MKPKTMGLAWIVVKDLKKAVEFYTQVIGLELIEQAEEFGWAELQGSEGGARFGIAEERSAGQFSAGQNALVTFTVDDIEKAIEELHNKGVQCIGEMEEVPGHVKIITLEDNDKNRFQIVQTLYACK